MIALFLWLLLDERRWWTYTTLVELGFDPELAVVHAASLDSPDHYDLRGEG